MSDKPQGPGWWLASDGTWHPPELHPSLREEASGTAPSAVPHAAATTALPPETIAPVTPPVPSLTVPPAPTMGRPAEEPEVTVTLPDPIDSVPQPVPSLPLSQGRPSWSAAADQRPEAGPMYPDLFQQAVSASRLADVVTVNFADGEHREALDVPPSTGPVGDPSQLVSAGGRVPAEVGAFTGASAKKRRWRL